MHINSPAELIFTLLPYSSYKIYQTVIQNIDVTIRHEGTDNNGWITNFKKQCVPTSQPGLHRHTATNQAFFRYLCETGVKLSKFVEENQEIKVHKQSTFLLCTLLGGLENIKNISDEQVVLLLQVILSGLKSSNQDLCSLSSVLLGYLLPKVTLKSKVVGKLCKSLAKFSKTSQSEETLQLVLLLARTQAVDRVKILELVVKHQPIINNIVCKAKTQSSDKDTNDLVDSLLFSLSLISEALIPGESST